MGRRSNIADARRIATLANRHYRELGAVIEAAAIETYRWMKRNSNSYELENGICKEIAEPWLPSTKPLTRDYREAILGRNALAARAYEHGVLNLFVRLAKRKVLLTKSGSVLTELDSGTVDTISDAMTRHVLEDLEFPTVVTPSQREDDNGAAVRPLSYLRRLFGNGNHSTVRIREQHLLPLATLGLLHAVYLGPGCGWQIRTGPVGRSFLNEVYLPIVFHYNSKYMKGPS